MNNLLEIQFEILANNSSFLEKQLTRSKKKLSKVIKEEEIFSLLSLQTELTKLKKRKQGLNQEYQTSRQLQTDIEIPPKK